MEFGCKGVSLATNAIMTTAVKVSFITHHYSYCSSYILSKSLSNSFILVTHFLPFLIRFIVHRYCIVYPLTEVPSNVTYEVDQRGKTKWTCSLDVSFVCIVELLWQKYSCGTYLKCLEWFWMLMNFISLESMNA